MGIITLLSNFYFGVVTILNGIIIWIISMKRKIIIQYALIIAIAYIIGYLIELLVLRIPNPFLYTNTNVLASRRGAIIKILNILSPYIPEFD